MSSLICSPNSEPGVNVFDLMEANGVAPATISASAMKDDATLCPCRLGDGHGGICINVQNAGATFRGSEEFVAPWHVWPAAVRITGENSISGSSCGWLSCSGGL
ncbi:MAG TPA: hypothetical protein VJ719_05340 [Chthoniobacterales bacterium]|nr:hypothetical protein [Chthoniobacterales bacterium]